MQAWFFWFVVRYSTWSFFISFLLTRGIALLFIIRKARNTQSANSLLANRIKSNPKANHQLAPFKPMPCYPKLGIIVVLHLPWYPPMMNILLSASTDVCPHLLLGILGFSGSEECVARASSEFCRSSCMKADSLRSSLLSYERFIQVCFWFIELVLF
jgi:hypothetical protein